MRHKDFGAWMKELFPFKVQKISVNAGFTCPNRDGAVGKGGCTFCNNHTFNPDYCGASLSVAKQLEEGKRFFARKYPDMKYLAYFQAYTNTYGSVEHVMQLYEEALGVDDVVGLVIGTRPDCMPDALLDRLSALAKRTFLLVEYGVESCNDATLRRINRGHDFACSRSAIERTHQRGIFTGAHIILGLPGEDREESLRQADIIASLPIDVLKIHQLQIVRGTAMAAEYQAHPFPLYSVEEYLNLVAAFIQRLPTTMVLDRFISQCPPQLLVAPRWGIKNYQFTQMLEKKMSE